MTELYTGSMDASLRLRRFAGRRAGPRAGGLADALLLTGRTDPGHRLRRELLKVVAERLATDEYALAPSTTRYALMLSV